VSPSHHFAGWAPLFDVGAELDVVTVGDEPEPVAALAKLKAGK